MSKYGFWNIDELKEELRKRGAKLSGRKTELVERLVGFFLHGTKKSSSATDLGLCFDCAVNNLVKRFTLIL